MLLYYHYPFYYHYHYHYHYIIPAPLLQRFDTDMTCVPAASRSSLARSPCSHILSQPYCCITFPQTR